MSPFENNMTVVGALAYGQAPIAVAYHPPALLAFKFGGQRNDRVTISVSSQAGDAVAWLLASDYSVVAMNDDADASTLDSLIQATLPGNTSPNMLTYYVVFRDYNYEAATFLVRLSKEFTRPPLFPLKSGVPRRIKPNIPPLL